LCGEDDRTAVKNYYATKIQIQNFSPYTTSQNSAFYFGSSDNDDTIIENWLFCSQIMF